MLFIGWGFWAGSGRAPQPVAALFDKFFLSVTGNDLLTRCSQGREFVGIRNCFDFASPKRYSGIFIEEFEGNRLLENERESSIYKPRDRVSLAFDEFSDLSAVPRLSPNQDKRTSRIFEVELIGRKAAVPNRGSMIGLGDNVILVDRLISARKLNEFSGYVPNDKLVRN